MLKALDDLLDIYKKNRVVYLQMSIETARSFDKLIRFRHDPSYFEKIHDNTDGPIREALGNQCASELFLFIQKIGGLENNYIKAEFDDDHNLKYMVCSQANKDECISVFPTLTESEYIDVEELFK